MRKRFGRALALAAALLLGEAAIPGLVAPAHAGCGCDHPLPAWAPVMPAFGYPGSTIRIDGNGATFKAKQTYSVEFARGLVKKTVKVVATSTDAILVTVPAGLLSGPNSIKVTGKGVSQTYGTGLFTMLSLPRAVPAGDAVALVNDYVGAVAEDGTLYVPFDLSGVADPTQFAMVLLGNPLHFAPEDVVFYNRDGFDLTLFTMAVDDPTQRQWGSYYGWDVKVDGGIVQTVYDTKVLGSVSQSSDSDLVTYWRHDFHAYRAAHAAGGAYEVSVNGYHKDGTLHVDHDFLVLAIDTHGQMRPGISIFDLLLTGVVSEGPVEPDVMAQHVMNSGYFVEQSGLLTNLGLLWTAADSSDSTKKTTTVAPGSVSLDSLGLMSAQ